VVICIECALASRLEQSAGWQGRCQLGNRAAQPLFGDGEMLARLADPGAGDALSDPRDRYNDWIVALSGPAAVAVVELA
jgi:hypothetical protein